jgi:hypothetical protein
MAFFNFNLKSSLPALCFIFIILPAINAQWFWNDHYYEIKTKGQTYHSKGKPEIDGEFTVFTILAEALEGKKYV